MSIRVAGKAESTPDAQASSKRPSDSPPLSLPREIRTAAGGVARFFFFPPTSQAAEPKAASPLLLVLPGGDGSAEFQPFVQSIHKQALQGRFAVAQVLAPPQIVWPTRSSTAKWRATGESIAAIVEEACKLHAIDRQQIYALAWSSSGPAVYDAALESNSPLAGAFIAMSVFRPDELPPLAAAKGRRFYLFHSPADAVCPYEMAKQAQEQLAAAGAKVTLVDYTGGHGWHGPVHDSIRAGLEWLQQR